MQFLLIGAGIVALLAFSGHENFKNPFSPAAAPPAAPGPEAQALNRNPKGLPGNFTPYGSGVTQGSPNSTLQTVNNSLVVANNALGLFGQMKDYFGDNSDSEYDIPASGDSDYFGGAEGT